MVSDSVTNGCHMATTTNVHPMITRSKVGTFKPKAYTAVVTSVPTNIHEAMAIPSWQAAVYDELRALGKNDT